MATDALVIPAQGVYNVLVAASITDWALAIGRMTDGPDKQLVALDTGGKAGEVAVAIDYPTVQLLIRGGVGADQYGPTFRKLKEARAALVAIPARPIQFPELAGITAIGDVVFLKYDEKERPLFSCNLQLTLWYDTSGYRVL